MEVVDQVYHFMPTFHTSGLSLHLGCMPYTLGTIWLCAIYVGDVLDMCPKRWAYPVFMPYTLGVALGSPESLSGPSFVYRLVL